MLLKSLKLKNIKTHRDTFIEFQPGINAIIGDNGSGKSTILEAIGAVLFQLVDYKAKEFITYGEKKGSIELVVNAEEQEFKIFKSFGSNSEYYVEVGNKRIDLKEEIVPWLRQVLGIEESVDLARLFQDVIGVPQGMLTSHFLLPPGARKKIFDPILNIESYPESVKQLLKVVNYAKEKISESEGLIQNYSGQTMDYEDLIHKEKSLKKEIESLKDDLKKFSITLSKLEAEKDDLTKQKDLVDSKKLKEELIRGLDALVKKLTSEIVLLKSSKEELEGLHQQAEVLLMIEEELRENSESLMLHRTEQRETNNKNDMIKVLKCDIKNSGKLLKDYDKVKIEADKYDEIKNYLDAKEIEMIKQQNTIEHLEKYESSVEIGNCPILECDCPNRDLKNKFTIMLYDAKNTENLESDIEDLKTKLSVAKKAKDELYNLVQIKNIKIEAEKELEELHKQQNTNHETEISKLENRQKELTSEAKDINVCVVGKIKMIEESLQDLPDKEKKLKFQNAEIEIHKKSIEEIEIHTKDFDQANMDYIIEKFQDARDDKSKCEQALTMTTKTHDDAVGDIERRDVIRRKKIAEEQNLSDLNKVHDKIVEIRGIMKSIPENLVSRYLTQINYDANIIFSEITNNDSTIDWTNNYEVVVDKKTFAQLSGGEQMVVALSLRLALLKNITSLDIAIFDEPTINLDEAHRSGLAEMMQQITGFKQLFVVSHDDTFSSIIENVIQIKKENETSSIL